MRKKNEKKFWDMEIIGNRRKIYIFNRENPHNSEPQNGPRRGLDFIALLFHELGHLGR